MNAINLHTFSSPLPKYPDYIRMSHEPCLLLLIAFSLQNLEIYIHTMAQCIVGILEFDKDSVHKQIES